MTDLFLHCFSRAQGCITVSALIFHEYFTTVKKKKFKSMKTHLLDQNALIFLRANFTSVAFKESSLPSTEAHLPNVLFFHTVLLLNY